MKLKTGVFAAITIAIIGWVGCNTNSSDAQKTEFSDKQKLEEKIASLEAKLMNAEKIIHKKTAVEALALYEGYAKANPDDEKSPEFMFRGAEVAIGLENYEKAVALFKGISGRYPDYEKAPEALFMTAFVYDAYAGEMGKAKTYYEKMIKKYPDHKLAQDAAMSIENLGLSDEELIEKFQKMEKAQQ